MITPKDSDINVKTLNIEEAKSPAISGLLKQLIVKPVVIESQVKEGKSAWYCYKYALNFSNLYHTSFYGEICVLNLSAEEVG